MNRRRHLNAGWRGALALIGACAFLVVGPALAQLGKKIHATQFKHAEYYEAVRPRTGQTNRIKSFLIGAEAQYLTNDLVRLISGQIENYAPEGNITNLVATSPECLFDTSNRLVSSTGRLEIVAMQRRLFVDGNEGFLLFLTNSTLIVSNRVRTYIHPDLLRNPSP